MTERGTSSSRSVCCLHVALTGLPHSRERHTHAQGGLFRFQVEHVSEAAGERERTEEGGQQPPGHRLHLRYDNNDNEGVNGGEGAASQLLQNPGKADTHSAKLRGEQQHQLFHIWIWTAGLVSPRGQ